MPKAIEVHSGDRYGQLLILREGPRDLSRKRQFYCRCVCEGEVLVRLCNLRSGNSTNCGCVRRSILVTRNWKHGGRGSGEYRSWANMIQRCHNPKHPKFQLYGGRGVRVDQRWRDSFQVFLDHIGPRPGAGYSVDRKDNEGHYRPGNVRWATQREQMRNTRINVIITAQGETATVAEWAERTGINPTTLYARIRRGWDDEDVVSVPVRGRVT